MGSSDRYLAVAEALKPILRETRAQPLHLVRFESDDSFLGYRTVVDKNASSLAETWFSEGESVVIDFGSHGVGYLSFALIADGYADTPARLRLVFGQVPSDIAEELYPSKSWMTKAWLPYEDHTIGEIPTVINISRRYAFRYVKIEIKEMSDEFKVGFHDLSLRRVTSAPRDVEPIPDPTVNRIDAVGLCTLRDCMQEVFEDGPRRDRGLFLGDLRLQALANYVTYQNNDLVKRCLYLFAGLRSQGRIMACVFDRPKPHPSKIYQPDYELLFPVALYEYVQHTGDVETGRDLFPVCQDMLERNYASFFQDGLFTKTDLWYFFDWDQGLKRTACMQAGYIFAYKVAEKLAKLIQASVDYKATIDTLSTAVLSYYDTEQGVFVCEGQVSWVTQAWMGLAQVLTPAEHVRAIQCAMHDPTAMKPMCPYGMHYVLEALHVNGATEECLRVGKAYYGGMVERGADTFWEVYDERDAKLSPYHDHHINSYCHGFACTMSWFIRQ
ncbi:hypothetical protein BZG36_05029 [Bifiguratus adelaidae]|uniref:Uncharacterized protein n=1 Tax=Bifiguratus adelaidae TaxID=1938954 RepID=A0A261XV97_9FUNG|nr:hypothetical protein BZG36_05029 [Bifiguratus adelaidae]